MTWNVEGIKANIHVLTDTLLSCLPDIAFLSEPQLFQTDLPQQMQYVHHEYCYWLSSDDLIDPELPLVKSRATGGTLVMWRKWLDPHISVHSVQSSAILPIILKLPRSRVSVHVALYLPTHGKDAEFVAELANLKNCLDELTNLYQDPIVFIRGDANSNPKNITRYQLLKYFISEFSLAQVSIDHPTYHHFVGEGKFDSNIDILLHSALLPVPEIVTEIRCKFDYPESSSHHDAIFSKFSLPKENPPPKSENLITAPRTSQPREKILWSPDGAKLFQEVVSPQLKSLRQNWLDPSSKTSTSVLLQATNKILTLCAKATNTSFPLNENKDKKRVNIPIQIKKAKRKLAKEHKKLCGFKKHPLTSSASIRFKAAQKGYRQAVRTTRLKQSVQHDQKLSAILSDKPAGVYGYIRSIRKTRTSKIGKLTVGDKVYEDGAVADGFYDSMTALKTCDLETLNSDPDLQEQLSNYEHILKICQDNKNIPLVSHKKASDVLKRLKSHVTDYYGITALHYTNAGEEGLIHFSSLLNSIITDVNNATIEELNLAYGLILYKGHGKEKTSDRSYRTISTCPFLAKALDLYLRDLYKELWDDCTAPTQYQTSGSSHELASLLVSETVQFSLNVADKPVYLLLLDAQSAFDRCLRQILCCELFKAGVSGTALILINNRLSSRSTVYQWDSELLGPATDDTGFEQGGINSGDYYKLYNNEQLTSAQSSGLGVNIGSSTVSAVGQADDVGLLANDLDSLRLLARLTETYCKKYRVKLVPSKTKLVPYFAPRHKYLVNYAELVNPVTIGGEPVRFVSEAEHVGVLRSSAGNMPNILQRISAHKTALNSVCSAGLTRGQRGNPAASIKVHQLYATSVLFSGLASLVLNSAEIGVIDIHYKTTLEKLQRLYQNTPRGVVYFLAGSLPAKAILHSKQLALFSMICHLPTDPLHTHARYVLSEVPSSAKSWFHQIRDICTQYGLPHPTKLLDNPPSKENFKKETKLRILEYWQDLLRAETMPLSSLSYFRPQLYSLSRPHNIWTSAGSNPFECSKSTVLAKMISGRYRTETLSRHWTTNKGGFCKAPTCHQTPGDLEHLLIVCPALEHVRSRLCRMMLDRTVQYPRLHAIIQQVLLSCAKVRTQFILEPMALAQVVTLYQDYGQPLVDLISYITRTYAFYIHREKHLIMGTWPGHQQKSTIDRGTSVITKTNCIFSGPMAATNPNDSSYATRKTPGASNSDFSLLSNHLSQHQNLQQSPSQKNLTTKASSSVGPSDCEKSSSSSAKHSKTSPQQPSNLLASPMDVLGSGQGESGMHFSSTISGP